MSLFGQPLYVGEGQIWLKCKFMSHKLWLEYTLYIETSDSFYLDRQVPDMKFRNHNEIMSFQWGTTILTSYDMKKPSKCSRNWGQTVFQQNLTKIIEKYGTEIQDVSNSHFKHLTNLPYFFNYYRHISSDTVCVTFRVCSVFQNFLS